MSRIPAILIVGAMAAAMSPTGSTADATGAPGDVTLRIVSRDATGKQLRYAYSQDISDDGRSVLLDTGFRGLRLKNLNSGALTRVDLRDNGSAPIHDGRDGQLAGDARRVVFTTFAERMTPETDTNSELDVFVRLLGTGRTEMVSVAVTGAAAGNDTSGYPAISPGGRYVTFRSLADDLVPGDANVKGDVFVRDLRTATTRLVSVSDDEQPANGGSWESAVSRDGRYVAFTSDANNLVEGDTNDRQDVFVRDLVEQTTRRVSVGSDGTEADRRGQHVEISGDGRYVTFSSRARTLSPQDTRQDHDIFVHDLVLGTTEWVSVFDGRSQAGTSLGPAISEHGHFVAFSSTRDGAASAVCSADHNVYLWNRTTKTARCLSPTYDGSATEGEQSYGASIDAHGNTVTFTSTVWTLVPRDANRNEEDAFLWRRSVQD